MAFIKAPLAGLRERTLADEGEYEMRIIGVQDRPSKAGLPMYAVRFAFVEGNYRNVTEYFMKPTEQDEPDEAVNKLLKLKRFLVQFGIPFEDDGFDDEQAVGSTAIANVVIRKFKDKQTGEEKEANAIRFDAFE